MASSATIPTTKTGDSTAGAFTPGPYEAVEAQSPQWLIRVAGTQFKCIASTLHGNDEANARELAHRFNCHDDLYEALKAAEDAMTREDFGTITLLPMIRAARAKAEGRS